MKDNLKTIFLAFVGHCQNHAVKSLETLRFKMLSTEIKVETEVLFSSGLTRSQVYNEIFIKMQSISKDELKFHL